MVILRVLFSGDPDYSNAFYAFDALLVLSLLVLTLKVDVVVEKDESGESLLVPNLLFSVTR